MIQFIAINISIIWMIIGTCTKNIYVILINGFLIIMNCLFLIMNKIW